MAKHLAADGHEVILLVAGFQGSQAEETRDGYKIIRVGNRYSIYWLAYQYYKKNMIGWADLVIDEMNTVPFFCKFYVQEKNILLVYQLCREIWFYQMYFPVSLLGFILEPLYLWMLRDCYVVTESESTKCDMQRYGFAAQKISIVPIGLSESSPKDLIKNDKFDQPTVLSLGSIRGMKRTLDQIGAFEIAKKRIPNLQLKIAGRIEGAYGEKVLRRISGSKYADDIEYLGHVDNATRAGLMQRSHLILVTSVKEGWGLIVTEANCQGTPAAVYDVDGLRDSVIGGETGMISRVNTPEGLAEVIVDMLTNNEKYERIRKNAMSWSCGFTINNSYSSFKQALNNFLEI
jgi:glycosyltransferase involved in cell wall biosynthesis